MCDRDIDPTPKKPADHGHSDSQLVAGEGQGAAAFQNRGPAEGDGESERVADEKENCRHRMHLTSLPDNARVRATMRTVSTASSAHEPQTAIWPHDLGGRLGFGSVPTEHGNEIFHDDWERRAFAVTQAAQNASGFNTDAFRHGIERQPHEVYFGSSYWQRWLLNAELMLVEGGVIGAGAVDAVLGGAAEAAAPTRTTDATPADGWRCHRPSDDRPRFTVGDRVRVLEAPPRSSGHTRLPSYVRGRIGSVCFVHGDWVYPDSHAHGEGEQPRPLYGVEFSSQELWPEDALAGDHLVVVDLFEPYLQNEPIGSERHP